MKQSQGYSVEVDPDQPLCYSCRQHKRGRDYFESQVFQDWLASCPDSARETIEAHTEWMLANPPPPQPADVVPEVVEPVIEVLPSDYVFSLGGSQPVEENVE